MNDLVHLTDLTNLPLSSNQKRLWIISQQDKLNPAYNVSLAYHLDGEINAELFEKSIEMLFSRQHTMFSVFRQKEGIPYINIVKRPVNIKLVDFSTHPDNMKMEEILSFMGEKSRVPFNLEEGPLYRLFIIKETGKSYFFCGQIHHIIFDGYSRLLFVQELSKIYTKLIQGIEDNDPPLKFHSYDFAALEHDALSPDDEKHLADFWKEYLNECPTELKFPNDFPRKSVSSGLGCRESFIISKSHSMKLRDLSKEIGTSLFNTLLSVLGIFIHKYTGDKDICIGVPVMNRRLSHSIKIFGLMVDTLPVRFKIDEDERLKDHFIYSNGVFKNAFSHSQLSFERIVEAVNPQRVPGLNPFFQISFSWINNFTNPMSLGDIKGERVSVKKGFSPFDITFYMWENGDVIEGEIEYSTDLFNPETIIRIKNHLLNLVSAIFNNSECNLKSLSLISEEEKKLIDDLNNTCTDYPKDKTIMQLFEEQVILCHDKPAVIFRESILTYSQLNKKANQLGNTLRGLGVKRDAPVGLLMDKSLDMIVGTLGILKAGGAYLPIDPEYPEQRVNFILKESGCNVLLTQSAYITKEINCANILNINSPGVFSPDCDNIESLNSSTDLAYIMYTSGTTGAPKGSAIQQQSVVRLVRKTNYIEILPEDRILLTGAIVFDATTFEIWGALLNGATLYVVDKETILDPEALGNELIKNDITILWLTSALFTQIAESRTDIFRKLKYFLVGGDVLSASHINKLRRENPYLKVINGYGPTENTTFSTTFLIENEYENNIPIGKPISNSTAYIFDTSMNYQPVGILGELYVGGDGLSRGYLNREDLNNSSFTYHPFKHGEKLYKTGDFARWLPDGNIEFHGRIDNQIKVRGYRIELGEIESAILEHPGIKNCAVRVIGAKTSNTQLIGYINFKEKSENAINDLKKFLIKRLPAYMIPSHFVLLDEMPMTTGGKIDRKALPEPDLAYGKDENGPMTSTEKKLMEIWKKLLKADYVGLDVNFFEAGGTSILVPAVLENIKRDCGIALKSVNIFEYPTIRMMADFISLFDNDMPHARKTDSKQEIISENRNKGSRDIAVIGLGGCFPGAENIDQYWDLIKTGKIAITRFTREELKKHGVAEELLDNPDYVYARAIIERAEFFEPSFFDIAPREADFMDPQHRLFLEVCYEAMEDAGYAPRTEPRNIGVFAGAGINNYLLKSLLRHPEALRTIGEFQNRINNGKDFLTTRVSYKLNFTGPSLDIQTACSTSLVAIHTACQSLLNQECDMALGGGVSIQYPRANGYLYKQGSILSPTGNCRPFDDRADGTISGEGAAVVLLKRLDDAVRDNDHIYAVIKATAINNDGAVKVGYMAPGLEGQAKVIRQAMDAASITPESITLIETHGTGTKLGDPIEISALKKAFKSKNENKSYCALGAVKANIGHLDAASGAAGLIKVVLALKNKKIPPLAGFHRFSPELDIDNSPFYASEKLLEWEVYNDPRRAAVSSFGIGGTNAHCIVEEWIPTEKNHEESEKYHLFPFSTKTESSLDKMNERYRAFFESTENRISDIAHTMQTGREVFKFRQMFVAKNLKDKDRLIVNKGVQLIARPRTIFMFTGQGSQYFQMSLGLYKEFQTFRKYIDLSSEILKEECGFDLNELLFSSNEKYNINDTIYAQPALVSVQYASAKLLEEFGMKPDMLIGHSIGELTAACVSGVMPFRDMLIMAARRGEIMQKQTRGSMLSVNLSERELRNALSQGIEISLLNAPEYCVVSGKEEDIVAFKEKLEKQYPGVQSTVLKTSHAFHSYLMEPALEPFRSVAEKTSYSRIGIPFISNTTGNIINDEQACSASYWADHIRKPVNFAAGINTLVEQPSLFIEVGPGNMLTSLLSQFNPDKGFKAIPTIRGAKQETDDVRYFLNAISQFWISGGNIDWSKLYDFRPGKVSLPTYSFNRSRHWVDTKTPFSFDSITDDQWNESDGENTTENVSKTFENQVVGSDRYQKPETEIQQILVNIWEKYLGVKGISITDDFFSLGGHSLLASQVINKINAQLGIGLPIDALFRAPDIKSLESLVLESKKASSVCADLPKVGNDGFLPVSKEQVRLWMVTQLDNNPAYNIPFTYRFKGNLNEEIFSKSINNVFNNHEILRGRIVTIDIEPALVIDKEREIEIQQVDFSDLSLEEREKAVEKTISDDIRKIFDIENDPLYRIYLIRTGENEVIFHMTIHHIIFDGWSWGIFVRDIKSAYTELLETGAISSHGEVKQYYEFAQWQKENITDAHYSSAVEYWKAAMEGYNGILHFPYDYPRKEVRTGLGKKAGFVIDKNVRNELRNLSKRLNVTDFVIYISTFSVLLQKYSKDDDFCVGIPSANRLSHQMEGIIGFFVNTLVLRFRLNSNLTFIDYVNETRKTIVGALEHQDFPFEKLVEEVQPPRTMNSNPIFQVLFAWLNTPSELFEFPEVMTQRCLIEDGVSHLDMTFYIWDRDTTLEGEVEYSVDVLSPGTIHQLIEDYLRLLARVAENPDCMLKDI